MKMIDIMKISNHNRNKNSSRKKRNPISFKISYSRSITKMNYRNIFLNNLSITNITKKRYSMRYKIYLEFHKDIYSRDNSIKYDIGLQIRNTPFIQIIEFFL